MRTSAIATVPALIVALLSRSASPADAAGEVRPDYQLPLNAPVVRAFEAPENRYAAGHRGVDLGATVGAVVGAAAQGEITFAGPVAGIRWVTILHPDGIKTSVGPIGELSVSRGDAVSAGQRVGVLAGGHGIAAPDAADQEAAPLHWSARDESGTYFDPQSLLPRADPWRPALVGAGSWAAGDFPPIPSYAPYDGRHASWGTVPSSQVASGPGWLIPPNANHVIGVAGLGSRTPLRPLDLTHLGYDNASVTYLSYAGRDGTATADPDDPWRDQLPYTAADTWAGVHDAALKLREQLLAHHARKPLDAVDLVGHSMGGVVVLYYLLMLHDATDPALPPIGHAVTVASPLEGSDLANMVRDARGSVVGAALVDTIDALADDFDINAQSLTDLKAGSSALSELERAWTSARSDLFASPLAGGTRVLTIAGSDDWVVAAHRAGLADSNHVTLPGGHDEVRETEAVRWVVRAFLADEPVPASGGGIGWLWSYPKSWFQRGVGFGLDHVDELTVLP